MYYQPKVIYRSPGEDRQDSVLRYIGTRVLRNNANMNVAITGMPGKGKSYLGLSLAEMHAKKNNLVFDANLHIIHTLRQLLLLIKNKELEKSIQIGTPLLFEEPQDAANARNWQLQSNKMLSLLLSTYRNQRLVVFFCTPYISMIDKQSRILFNAEFNVLGFDKNTGFTSVKPRFLEYNGDMDKFYRKKLIVNYAVHGKNYYIKELVSKWQVPKATSSLIDEYEVIKKKYSEDLVERLWNQTEKETKEKKMLEKENKSEEFFKIVESYQRNKNDFIAIQREFPHIGTFALDKLIFLAKKSYNDRLAVAV